ncbi:uncharacterized protein EV422DRAFT_145119 [Fimicolochytrium jonesii]|uniref:uncharacterized protein n=1 Tax=Fimicolochytrium jonesii TaxID=1396493 RepID=UPI0022FE378D|nr:uncharacterized protein EV422DRAFT_145119 [Fimicolochytrium jonesii]KAI8825887.1 hypothetical protein EV422DRAFT_145119 [Fimicolochytrium jonesii]
MMMCAKMGECRRGNRLQLLLDFDLALGASGRVHTVLDGLHVLLVDTVDETLALSFGSNVGCLGAGGLYRRGCGLGVGSGDVSCLGGSFRGPVNNGFGTSALVNPFGGLAAQLQHTAETTGLALELGDKDGNDTGVELGVGVLLIGVGGEAERGVVEAGNAERAGLGGSGDVGALALTLDAKGWWCNRHRRRSHRKHGGARSRHQSSARHQRWPWRSRRGGSL